MGALRSISRGVAKAASVVKGIQKSVATTAIKTVASSGTKILPAVKNVKIFGKSSNVTKAVSSVSKYSGVASAAALGYTLSSQLPFGAVHNLKSAYSRSVFAPKKPSVSKRPLGVTNSDVNTLASGVKAGGSMGLLGKAGKYAAGAAAVGGALYLGEQLAEKAGVRGGAGFIGSRPMGTRGHRRRGIISKRAMKNIRRVNSYKKQVKKAARVLGLFKSRPVAKGGKK